MFGFQKKESEKAKVSDISPSGFKLNYGKLKKAVMECEINRETHEIDEKCRKIFKELNVEIIE